jgi:hypothetical protein
MSRGPCAFRQRDVARLVKAATAAGLQVAGVRVDTKSGLIEVMTAVQGSEDSRSAGENEWDELLNAQ